MIKPKTKFLGNSFFDVNFESGCKAGLFQSSDKDGDGYNDVTGAISQELTGILKAKKEGNQDTKILAAVYEQFVEDGKLTKQEIEKLQYLDKALGGSEIAVNLKTGNAAILQKDDAQTFNLDFPGKPKGNIGR